ncbi:MAG: radical SAM protein, partial [Planctomycetota bacterium]
GILGQLKAAGCTTILVTGGEPLLHPACLSILRRAKQEGLLVSLYTNGSLVDEETAAELGELNLVDIAITLYGADAATHDRYTRCPGSFGRVTEAVRRLNEAGCNLRLRWYALPASVEQTGAFIDLAESLGVRWQASGVITARRDGTCSRRVSDAQLFGFYRTVVERFYSAEGLLARAKQMAEALDRSTGPETRMCGAGLAGGRIDPAGVLYTCMDISDPVGDLRRVPFADAWKRTADISEGLRLNHFPDCEACRYFWACNTCPGAFRAETGSWGETPREQCRNTHLRLLAISRCADELLGDRRNPLAGRLDDSPFLETAHGFQNTAAHA